ncbi:unnamed protein product [Adineta ricciae]|uniref:Uncharacterized protein n=1 Tax=Adineta ricciae TaxID=249248 RepID=A0A815S6X1_ADIRI|nr:unnamed protein product [Adineta ricciae]
MTTMHVSDQFIVAKTLQEQVSSFNSQTHLNTTKVVKRTIKYTHAQYICPEEQWNEQINCYLASNDVFVLVGDMHTRHTKEILHNMSNLIVRTIHQLLYRRLITNEQYGNIMFYNQRIDFNVNQLNFTIKMENVTIYPMALEQMVLEPIIQCSNIEPMKGISNLINTLLQPLVTKFFRNKQIVVASDAIDKWREYADMTSMPSCSYFVTIHLRHLRSSLPFHLIIASLEHFFHYFGSMTHINGISTATILQLTRLLLDNQYCIYENKLYRQTFGCSIDAPLMTTLIDIYMFSWQRQLLQRVGRNTHRFYCRSLNHICFLWRQSKEEFYKFFDKTYLANATYSSIEMSVSVDSNEIRFLDAILGRQPGDRTGFTRIYTHVAHRSTFEPYALPYISKAFEEKYQRYASSLSPLLTFALLRAILYCSDVREFENERLFIELSFALNGVSLYDIEKIIENFFVQFHESSWHIMRTTQVTYEELQCRVRGTLETQLKWCTSKTTN